MKNFLLIAVLSLFIIGCKKTDDVIQPEPGLIENQIFNATVFIDGHDYDGTIIKNCIFENIEGDGLQIRDVDNLCIENCIFRDISEDGIRFRNSGSSNGVKLINNQLYNIAENGILCPEDHINAVLKNNLIYNVATSSVSSLAGAPHHGIYWQGSNVVITENTIYDIINPQGNCISIRTNGKVSKNILHNATDHGVSYFSDHPGFDSELLIENNIIYDNGKRGINISSNGNSSNHIGTATIRFNTIISSDQSPIAMTNGLSDVAFVILGNVLVRTDGESTFIFTVEPYIDQGNLFTDTDIGFVNFSGRNLKLTASATAIDFAAAVTEYPFDDFEGDLRISAEIDAGADEY